MINTGRHLWGMKESEMADQVERITMAMHRKKGNQSLHKTIRVPSSIEWFISEIVTELFPGLVGFSERINVVTMIGCLFLAEKFGERLRQGGKAPRNRFQSFREEVQNVTDTVYDAQNVISSMKDLLHAVEAVKSDINQMNAIDSSITKIIASIPEDVWRIASDQLSTDRRFAAYTSRQAERIRKQQAYEEQLFILQ
jgi:gas vesicle protein